MNAERRSSACAGGLHTKGSRLDRGAYLGLLIFSDVMGYLIVEFSLQASGSIAAHSECGKGKE
jgi:hypothetical protein